MRAWFTKTGSAGKRGLLLWPADVALTRGALYI